MSAIAVSVAKANAILFSQLLMSPGHTMDSNADQSVAHGHCGVFVVGDFLRKGMDGVLEPDEWSALLQVLRSTEPKKAR